MSKPKRKRREKRKVRVFPIILVLFVLVVGIILLDSNTRLTTTEYELHYGDLPDSFDGYRIVVLSDIHAAVFGEGNERLISRVKDAEPDIIAITGDFIDKHDKLAAETQLEIAESLVMELAPIAPVYYITGNHDWNSGELRQLISMLEEHEVRVLRNRYSLVFRGDDSIILAGTDDPNGPADMTKPAEFVAKIHEAEEPGFIVMLEHRNNNLKLYSELGVDLVICGHAHGGLVRLPFTDGLVGPQRDWFPTYTNGVYTMGDTNMVISRGIGNHTGVPRFLNNPQVVVVVLRNADGG